MARLPEFDADMGRLAAEAEASGQVLRYVGVVDVKVGVGVKMVFRLLKVISKSFSNASQ